MSSPHTAEHAAERPLRFDFDADEALQFLDAIFAGTEGLIEVRPIPDPGQRLRAFVSAPAEAVEACRRAAEVGANVYIGIATRRSAGDGKKSNLREVSALWVDLDDPDRAELDRRLAGFPHPPSVVIASGGGFHLYWLLDTPVDVIDPENIDRFEAVQRGLCAALGGDRAATDVSHVMRVPGTTNWPNAKKRAAGRVPAPCTLVACDPDRRYALDDFDAFEQRGQKPNGANREDYQRQDWNGTLPELVRNACQVDPDVARYFDQSRDALGFPSESEADLSLANKLAAYGIAGADLEAALRFRRAQIDGNPKHDGYFRQTVEKALAGRALAAGGDAAATEGAAPLPLKFATASPTTIAGG